MSQNPNSENTPKVQFAKPLETVLEIPRDPAVDRSDEQKEKDDAKLNAEMDKRYPAQEAEKKEEEEKILKLEKRQAASTISSKDATQLKKALQLIDNTMQNSALNYNRSEEERRWRAMQANKEYVKLPMRPVGYFDTQ